MFCVIFIESYFLNVNVPTDIGELLFLKYKYKKDFKLSNVIQSAPLSSHMCIHISVQKSNFSFSLLRWGLNLC